MPAPKADTPKPPATAPAPPAAQPPRPGTTSAKPAAAGPDAATATPPLKPGQFLWMPELSPQGPVVVVVSLPEQRAHVYRNGVRIGVSTISSGMRGFETRTGVYPIIERQTEHYSNLYDNAPMPYMLRLTWSGTALHAGRIPGYPASHGCIRLPKPFAQVLFDTVRRGTVVVIADDASHPPDVVSPGWVSPVDPATGAVFGLAQTAASEAAPDVPAPDVPAPDEQAPASSDMWAPERAPEGPLSLLASIRDRQLMVLRNGIEIGRAEVALTGEPAAGTRVHTLRVETPADDAAVADPAPESRWVSSGALRPPPPIPTLHWRAIAQPGKATAPGTGQPPLRAGTLRFDDGFARQLLPLLSAETTLVITDEALPPPRAITPPPAAPSALPAPPAPAGPLPAPP